MTAGGVSAAQLPGSCCCGRVDFLIKQTTTRAKNLRCTITCQRCGFGCVSSSRDGDGGGSVQAAILLWNECYRAVSKYYQWQADNQKT
jgi:hypothetical protein